MDATVESDDCCSWIGRGTWVRGKAWQTIRGRLKPSFHLLEMFSYVLYIYTHTPHKQRVIDHNRFYSRGWL